MKRLRMILSLSLVFLLLTGCGSSSSTKKWVASEMADLVDPGFTISNKTVSNSVVRYEFTNLSDQKVSDFFGVLYGSGFIVDQNYNAGVDFASYAAFNEAGESIQFIYNVTSKSGVLIFGKDASSHFVPGFRDMGYIIQSNYEYASNDDNANYVAFLYYSVSLNVERTNYQETVSSIRMFDFKFKSTSRLGNLSFAADAWSEPPVTFTKNGSTLGELNFLVRQTRIGVYPISMEYTNNKSVYFDAMNISQADLNFTVSFTVELTTNLSSYTKDYEITIMPSGFDTTKMNDRQYIVDQKVAEFSLGVPYSKK